VPQNIIKMHLRLGSALDPAGGAYNAAPDLRPPSWIWGRGGEREGKRKGGKRQRKGRVGGKEGKG